MGKKRKRQRAAAPPGETFRLVDNGENLLSLVLRRDAVSVAEESELLAFINDGLARGRHDSLRADLFKSRRRRSRSGGAVLVWRIF